MGLVTRSYDVEIPEDADVMTVEDFKEGVDSGAFKNTDGNGYWAKGGMMSKDDEYFTSYSLDATHVVWFNK